MRLIGPVRVAVASLPDPRRIALVLVAGVVLAGCGGKAPTAVQSHAAPKVPTPTVTELEGWLTHALDPAVPAADKAIYGEGNLADGALIAKLSELYRAEGAGIDVRHVTRLDPTDVMVDADLRLWGNTYPQQVPFVYDGGHWKVSMDWACNAAAVIQLSSPACIARG